MAELSSADQIYLRSIDDLKNALMGVGNIYLGEKQKQTDFERAKNLETFRTNENIRQAKTLADEEEARQKRQIAETMAEYAALKNKMAPPPLPPVTEEKYNIPPGAGTWVHPDRFLSNAPKPIPAPKVVTPSIEKHPLADYPSEFEEQTLEFKGKLSELRTLRAEFEAAAGNPKLQQFINTKIKNVEGDVDNLSKVIEVQQKIEAKGGRYTPEFLAVADEMGIPANLLSDEKVFDQVRSTYIERKAALYSAASTPEEVLGSFAGMMGVKPDQDGSIDGNEVAKLIADNPSVFNNYVKSFLKKQTDKQLGSGEFDLEKFNKILTAQQRDKFSSLLSNIIALENIRSEVEDKEEDVTLTVQEAALLGLAKKGDEETGVVTIEEGDDERLSALKRSLVAMRKNAWNMSNQWEASISQMAAADRETFAQALDDIYVPLMLDAGLSKDPQSLSVLERVKKRTTFNAGKK